MLPLNEERWVYEFPKEFTSNKDLPIPITILALLVSNASDKIEELTSIPSMIIHYIALGLMLFPLYI